MAYRIFSSIINELLIIFLFIFILTSLVGPVENQIKADGKGYYDYLPSIFIYHDLVRKDARVNSDSALYQRINTLKSYVDYGNFKVNKYACGTSVMELPFFIVAWSVTDLEGNYNDGFQKPFQNAVVIAAFFYLFLALYFTKRTLELYHVKGITIKFVQLLIAFATGVTNYAYYDACFSHIYSLFAVSAFIFFIKLYFDKRTFNSFFLACLLFGLILILRQINILIILFIPFIAGSWQELKSGLIQLLKNPLMLLTGLVITASVFFIQSLLWYLQTGDFLVYSYQGEGFNFFKPNFINILFSYQKGLFVYTPVLFITLFSLVWLSCEKKFYLVSSWLLFFIVLTFVLSSWHSWIYGASYGQRPYIEFYPAFFIPFALMLDVTSKPVKAIIVFLSLLTIPLNMVQTYQYQKFILHWTDMDKDKYWEVFLKTNDRFKGILWKKSYRYEKYKIIKEIDLGDLVAPARVETMLYTEYSSNIPDFDKVVMIQVMFDNEFNEKNNSSIILSINDSTNRINYYWLAKRLVSFKEKGLNKWQTGLYNYEITRVPPLQEKYIIIKIGSGGQPNDLKAIKIRFFGYN